ncbi:flavin reductase family protein [Ornithinibacillus halotolerans]|uniref:Flavin reductase n=1 Tax=Ornithinibacillus halotolerans TaxID=1274357 RepID=A0A916W8M8_9BACI|nr:flavin reductase family protein [Ornithinibacillus halotolerans]GGA78138.1 flavin reductase [Ornithinibacillus halotolerans]
MLSFDPESNTERENYKLLIGSIVPRPIAFVTTMTDEGVINGAPFSYFNIVSSNPPLISISIQRKEGQMKDTARNINSKGEFVVHIVDEDNVDKINKTAATLAPDKSEIEISSLTLLPSEVITVPGVKEAKVRMECVLEINITLEGSDEAPGTDLIIGKVVRYHINENVYENGKIDHEKLAAVSRLAGSNYAKIGDVFAIERPK